jgi:hypothetical protein
MRRTHSGGRTQVDLPSREGGGPLTKGAVGHPGDGREFVEYLDCALVGGGRGLLAEVVAKVSHEQPRSSEFLLRGL